MPDTFTTALHDWQSFYALIGEASATLTGLMFVAVSLGARILDDNAQPKIRTFLTPTVIYFSLVLLLAALMNVPTQTRPALAGELGGVGLVGAAYALSHIGRLRDFSRAGLLAAQNWAWHCGLPLLAALSLLASAAALEIRAPLSSAFNLAAFGGGLLVMVGLHNAWNATLYLALRTDNGGET